MDFLFDQLPYKWDLCCLPVPLIAMVVMAIVGFRWLSQLQQRITDLERDQRDLRASIERPEIALPTEPVEAAAAPSDAINIESIPVVRPAPQRPHRPPVAPASAVNWEAFIGGRALGWVAVLLLLFAGAFFINYAIENEWIDELGRVVLGVVLGLGLCVGGFLMHRRSWNLFAQMLTAAGVVLLYLMTFASFGYYHLLPRQAGAIFLILIIAETGFLALLYEAPAIAIMAVIGGLLAPILLHSERDQYVNLFIYLTVLNTGVVLLGLARHWWVMLTLALAGTQVLFWGWYDANFHPEKRAACLLFQGGLFALYLSHALILNAWRKQSANLEDLGRWLLNATCLAAAGYVLLEPTHRPWLGTFALGVACLYTLMAWLLQAGRSADGPLQFTAVATAMGFVAMVVPLETDGNWTSVGWAIQGLCLAVFGMRIRSLPLRLLGAAFLFLATCWLFGDTRPFNPRLPWWPFLNRFAATGLILAACLLLVAWLVQRFQARLTPVDLVGMWLGGIAGLGLLWFILSVDVYRIFEVRAETALATALPVVLPPVDPDQPPEIRDVRNKERAEAERAQYEQYDKMQRAATTSLSVVWALFGAGLLALGFWMRNSAMRWGALALFGVTIGKAVIIDMEGLPGLYRVVAFFVLAVVLGAAAWGYQRFSHLKGSASGGNHP